MDLGVQCADAASTCALVKKSRRESPTASSVDVGYGDELSWREENREIRT